MIEVSHGLYVGDQLDYETQVEDKDGWAVLHAAKEPYHRKFVGYTGRGLMDRSHPEYLFAYRDNRLALNMIDAPSPDFFRDEMIEAGLDFIASNLRAGHKVFVHCNQGASRSPSLALLYLRRHTETFNHTRFGDAEEIFRNIYPPYAPAPGIRSYVRQHWQV